MSQYVRYTKPFDEVHLDWTVIPEVTALPDSDKISECYVMPFEDPTKLIIEFADGRETLYLDIPFAPRRNWRKEDAIEASHVLSEGAIFSRSVVNKVKYAYIVMEVILIIVIVLGCFLIWKGV